MVEHALLWLFLVNLGVVFGAGIYEARIAVPRWRGLLPGAAPGWYAEEAERDDTGRRFWAFTTTVPLTLLTLANLWAAYQETGPLRTWWLLAAVSTLADRLFTFFYFIPRMVRLMRTANSAQSQAAAAQWARLNFLRLSFVLIAWLAAIQAFGLAQNSTRGH